MRIGELADAAGVSTRTVRHYHRVGLLPEPPRRANGYRVYGLRDTLRLTRARRLVQLGLSLDEAADALADDEGREVAEILGELDADLAAQEEEIRARRARLAELLAKGPRLDADDAVSPPTAELRDRLAGALPDSPTARHDREFLALIDRGDPAQDITALYRAVLADPEQLAGVETLYRRFDDLAAASPDDPQVLDLARDLAAALPSELAAQVDGRTAIDDHPVGAAVLADLAPAQAAVVRAAFRIVVGSPGTAP